MKLDKKTNLALSTLIAISVLYNGCVKQTMQKPAPSETDQYPEYIFEDELHSLNSIIYALHPEKNASIVGPINAEFGDPDNFSTDIKLFYNSKADTLDYITLNSRKISKGLLKKFLPGLTNELELNRYGYRIH